MNNPESINKIFWGLLLVLTDVNIMRFDLLPDGIGYLPAAYGLRKLKGLSGHFSEANITAFLLAGLSVPAMFLSRLFSLTGLFPETCLCL
ncbi:hypothetical protein [Siminovitchia sp. 179-K 8D1 HS]|uniref:hypothetical protein n=1 Tax=Siminovitchia sp. 179-K 8D1 HS TaxID=3142385 RepID=UPI00399FBF49